MDPVAKLLVIAGGALIVVGLSWQMGWIQSLRIGRLPGDIFIERENLKVYIPITSGILLSLLVTFLSWVFRRP
jgi:hypothetical protein